MLIVLINRGISEEEAKVTLDAWYNDRPEVKKWQDDTKKFAKKNLIVRTLMVSNTHKTILFIS